MTLEEKMKIVINNYFKSECSVNTSIREAFEKGFRIGVSKAQKKGKWIKRGTRLYVCECGRFTTVRENYCPNCGADMREEKENEKVK